MSSSRHRPPKRHQRTTGCATRSRHPAVTALVMQYSRRFHCSIRGQPATIQPRSQGEGAPKGQEAAHRARRRPSRTGTANRVAALRACVRGSCSPGADSRCEGGSAALDVRRTDVMARYRTNGRRARAAATGIIRLRPGTCPPAPRRRERLFSVRPKDRRIDPIRPQIKTHIYCRKIPGDFA